MKKLLVFIGLMFFGIVSYADTINLHWLNDDGTTYQNSSCTVDGDLIVPTTPPTKYGYTFAGWKILPYIPIEYLESTGTQYIDTGYAYTREVTRTYVKYAYTTNTVAQKNLFGCSVYDGKYITAYTQTSSILAFFIGSGAKTSQSFSTSDNAKHTLEIYTPFSIGDKGYITIDGSDTVYIKNASNVSGANMGIFTQIDVASSNMAASRGGSFKIYKFIMYDNNVLVRDFIPVLDPNGTPCMFDKVEGKFYYNAGTGNFIAGPVLSE